MTIPAIYRATLYIYSISIRARPDIYLIRRRQVYGVNIRSQRHNEPFLLSITAALAGIEAEIPQMDVFLTIFTAIKVYVFIRSRRSAVRHRCWKFPTTCLRAMSYFIACIGMLFFLFSSWSCAFGNIVMCEFYQSNL